MKVVAPLFLMCDRGDIRVHHMVRDPFLKHPVYILQTTFLAELA